MDEDNHGNGNMMDVLEQTSEEGRYSDHGVWGDMGWG